MKRKLYKLSAMVLTLICYNNQAAMAQVPNYSWAVVAGSTLTDFANGVVADDAGNVYVTGNIQGLTDFDPGPATVIPIHAGGNDIFIAKYNQAGAFQWVKTIGGVGADIARSIARDNAGNLYITGAFAGNVDFDPGLGTAQLTATGNDIFLAKYDADGNYIWAKRMGGTGSDIGYEVALDAIGNPHITGYFSGTAYFDPSNTTTTLTSTGNRDAFVAKYDTSGNYVWAAKAGGTQNDEAWAIALDQDNNAYITGYLATSAAATSRDGFLNKYSPSGSLVWAKSIGGTMQDHGADVTVDGSNNVIVTGLFRSSPATFAPGVQLTSDGSGDIFIAKYDSSGAISWVKGYGNTNLESGNGVSVDASNNIYLCGHFASDTVNFNPGGSGGIITALQPGVFVTKLDATGNFLWSGNLDGSEPKIYAHPSQGTYIYGGFLGGDLNPGSDTALFTSVPGPNNTITSDAFVVKLLSCADTSTVNASTCQNSYTFYNQTLTMAGTYSVFLPQVGLCDSFIVLNLSFFQLEPIITIELDTLATTQSYSSYQWLLNGSTIPGATNAKYTIGTNGNYQVIVSSEDNCIDTSEVYAVTNHGLSIWESIQVGRLITIYPNPAKNQLFINSPLPVNVDVTSIDGRCLLSKENATSLMINSLSQGVYFVRISDKEGRMIKIEKLIKD